MARSGTRDGKLTRILWFGDLAATGFGTVTMDAGRALLGLGEDVRFVSQNEVPDLPEPFASRTIDTRSLLARAARIVQGHIEAAGIESVADFVPKVILGEARDHFMVDGTAWGDWKPDVCFLLGDYKAAEMFAAPYLRAFSQVPTYHYVPIEGVDLPPVWANLWRILRPIAMSNFGADEIARIMGYRPPVIYHGVDVESFWPVSPSRPLVLRDGKDARLLHRIDSKARAKAFFGQDPRKKWILRTDRHMPRKNYNGMLRALAPLLKEREDTMLMMHVGWDDQGGNLDHNLSKYDAVVRSRCMFTGLGAVPRNVLAALYNAADVYVSTSAEGFGLTIAEAIACGVPAVGMAYSAVPEVIGPAGVLASVDVLTDNEYDHFWARPVEEEVRKAVGWLLDHPHRAQAIGALGPAHVREHFTWKQAAEGFAKLAHEAAGN